MSLLSAENIVIVALCVVFVIMAIEDWKHMEVSGYACLVAWELCMLQAVLFSGSYVCCALVPILSLLFYEVKKDIFLTSADVIPLVAYVVVYCFGDFELVRMVMFPAVLLVLLVPYGYLWAKAHGITWKLGDMVPMPMLPCFAAAWICTFFIDIAIQALEGASLW